MSLFAVSFYRFFLRYTKLAFILPENFILHFFFNSLSLASRWLRGVVGGGAPCRVECAQRAERSTRVERAENNSVLKKIERTF